MSAAVEVQKSQCRLTLVRLSLLSELAGSLDGGFAPVLAQVLVAHDLTTDELVLEIRAARYRQPRLTKRHAYARLTG